MKNILLNILAKLLLKDESRCLVRFYLKGKLRCIYINTWNYNYQNELEDMLRPLTSQQERGLKQSLPLGHNILDISTTTTSDSTPILIPFISQELNIKNGPYYGINATSKKPIFFKREKSLNGNELFLGAPGGGKSFYSKPSNTAGSGREG